MSTIMITVTHKMFDDSHLKEGYQVVSVGNTKVEKQGWRKDSDGENISYENPWYCELTAQYYGWKNLLLTEQYVGICHYRRYFMSYKASSKSIWEDIISTSEIEKILSVHKIILPYMGCKVPGSSMLLRGIEDEKQDKNWLIIRDIIHSEFPDYSSSFDKIIYGMNQVWFNMFIARKEVFEAYCSWIFLLLKKYDEHLVAHELKRTPRVDGFLSELLLLVWVDKNIKPSEIYNLDVKNVEQTIISYDNKGSIKGRILRKLYCHKQILDIGMTIKCRMRTFRVKMKIYQNKQKILDSIKKGNEGMI